MITLAGCGDAFITRQLPQKKYSGFVELADYLQAHDVCFCNLETTIHHNEGYPSLFPGGGWAMAKPAVLDSLKEYGFNAVSIANNHTMDYCHKGLEATLEYLQKSGLLFAGAGLNLSEASAPKYVECSEGRVAFIALTSSFHDSDAAGYQGLTVSGRPGINPLRHRAIYQLVPELYEKVLEIAKVTGMNDTLNWSARNGYQKQNSNAKLRTIEFSSGNENKKISSPLTADLSRTVRSIQEAKTQADCIVISVHSHQFKGNDEIPDDFIVEFCHSCIDAGAHIIFGHGSHILRGIECYGNGVIFYGLGDFILQNETVERLPADFYEKYCKDQPELHDSVGKAMLSRSKNGTIGLSANPKAWQSIAVSIKFSNQIESVSLIPLELQYKTSSSRRGWPVITPNGDSILKTIANLSAAYSTNITIKNNVGYIQL